MRTHTLGAGQFDLINCPAPNVWVFTAHLVEHCSTKTEATVSSPVEALKIFLFFFGLNYNCDGHIFISFVFLQFTSFSFFKLRGTGQNAYGGAVVLTSLQVLNFIFFNESEMYPSLDEVSLVTSLNSCQCLTKLQVLTGKYLHTVYIFQATLYLKGINDLYKYGCLERVFNI